MHSEFWWGKLLENGHLEDQEENNNRIDVVEICCEHARWIELAQDRVQRRAFISGVEYSGSASRELVNFTFSVIFMSNGTMFLLHRSNNF
jgi:hypothetical protein